MFRYWPHGKLADRTLQELIDKYHAHLLGPDVLNTYGKQFPLLIKFIDAADDLSIQVHPNDEQSNGCGKTEMWHILQADANAHLLCGFREPTHVEGVRQAIADGSFEQLMNRVPVSEGDTFYIPANRVHTIGRGILLAEIQQSSDITYRIYDFNRKNDQGQLRELHIEEALEVMDFGNDTGQISKSEGNLVDCDYFITDKLKLSVKAKLEVRNSFQVLIVTSGNATLKWAAGEERASTYQTYLLPAWLELEIEPIDSCEVLLSYVR